MKNNFTYFKMSLVAAYLIIIVVSINAQTPCPEYGDLLDHGWWAPINDPHNPEDYRHLYRNADEYAATDPSPFIIKVNNYPPVKSFPITPMPNGCSNNTYYYFSFDTDGEIDPIKYPLTQNVECTVKTYRVDQNFNYISGYSMIVKPPAVSQIGGSGAPDFVMKYNGTYHDVAWSANINLYP